LGALGAVRLNQNVDVSKAIEFFVSSGVWIRPINDTVYIAPAFTIDEPELQTLCDAVKDFVLANL
jgi:adenosylmethionine-8-amino-7-oxononanoate aminotransferase